MLDRCVVRSKQPAKALQESNSIGLNGQPTTQPEFKQPVNSTQDGNPFYNPKLTPEAAAKYIYKIFKAALSACEAWLTIPIDRVQAAMKEKGDANQFLRMSRDFKHIHYFLEHGRVGWDLTFLPENFFKDVECVLDSLLFKVEQISKVSECEGLYESCVVPLRNVKTALNGIKKLRKRIWEESKEGFEKQLEAKKVVKSGDRVVATRPMAKAVSQRAKNGMKVEFEGDV